MNKENEKQQTDKFVYLQCMKNEYADLSLEHKQRYMNILTEWYMHEKDALNIELNKEHKTTQP